jgi:hypothetical protein
MFFFLRLDPVPEPFVDETAKAVENEDTAKDQFDASLPPELRKLMEQAKEREEAVAAAAAAEAQPNKEEPVIDQSGTQGSTDEKQDGKDVTQISLADKVFNGITH